MRALAYAQELCPEAAERCIYLSIAVVSGQVSERLGEEGRRFAGAPLDQRLEAAQQAAHIARRHLQTARLGVVTMTQLSWYAESC